MPHFMERASAVSDVLDAVSRRLNRPLSLLAVDALDVEGMTLWEKWVRRIIVFTPDSNVRYHMVNDAVGLDLYQRFNFRVRPIARSDIPLDPQVAWPFDVINVTITNHSWKTSFGHPITWKRLLQQQLKTPGDFLLVVQGESHCLTALHDVLTQVNGPSFKPLRFLTFRSDGVTAALRIWSVSNQGAVGRQPRSAQDEDEVTDLILWGEGVE